MRTASTFSILFWMYGERAVNNKANLYVRVTHNGKRVNISLKRKADVNSWDTKKQKIKGNGSEAGQINLYLNEVHSRIFQIYSDLNKQEIAFTSQTVKSLFLGVSKKHPTFKDLISYHNDKLTHQLHPNTISQYKTSQKYMLDYINKEYGEPDIDLRELNFEFITGFENFLRSYQPKSGHPKIGNNTAMKHIKRLRKMASLAYRMEWIEKDPFIRFKIKTIKKEREFLSAQELQRIEKFESSIERLIVVRDLFVFSCYTGISYVDIGLLNDDNLFDGIDGKPWLMAKRRKTGTPFKLPILPKVQILLRKYKSHFRTIGSKNFMPKTIKSKAKQLRERDSRSLQHKKELELFI
jgi:hypothetical protein